MGSSQQVICTIFEVGYKLYGLQQQRKIKEKPLKSLKLSPFPILNHQSSKLLVQPIPFSLLLSSFIQWLAPLHMCKHTIGLQLGQPLILSHLSLFRTVICTVDTGLACTCACLLTCDCHAPEAFSLRYMFVLLGFVRPVPFPCLLAQVGSIWLMHQVC